MISRPNVDQTSLCVLLRAPWCPWKWSLWPIGIKHLSGFLFSWLSPSGIDLIFMHSGEVGKGNAHTHAQTPHTHTPSPVPAKIELTALSPPHADTHARTRAYTHTRHLLSQRK